MLTGVLKRINSDCSQVVVFDSGPAWRLFFENEEGHLREFPWLEILKWSFIYVDGVLCDIIYIDDP